MPKIYATGIDKISSSKFKKMTITENGIKKELNEMETKKFVKNLAQGGKSLETLKKKLVEAGVVKSQEDKRNALLNLVSGKNGKISLDEQSRMRKVAEAKAKMNVAIRRRFDLAQEEKAYKEAKGGLREDAMQGGSFAGISEQQHSAGIGEASRSSTVSAGINTPQSSGIQAPPAPPSRPSMLGRIGGFINPFKK